MKRLITAPALLLMSTVSVFCSAQGGCPGFDDRPPGTYAMTLSITGNGEVRMGSPVVWYRPEDTPITLYYPAYKLCEVLALPDDGWRFDRWEGDLTGSFLATYNSLTMNGDKQVTAVFVPIGPGEDCHEVFNEDGTMQWVCQ